MQGLKHGSSHLRCMVLKHKAAISKFREDKNGLKPVSKTVEQLCIILAYGPYSCLDYNIFGFLYDIFVQRRILPPELSVQFNNLFILLRWQRVRLETERSRDICVIK